jgi:integrase
MTTLAAEGLAPETIKGIRGTLARALDQAVLDDVLPRNVARLERKKRTRRLARSNDDKFAFTRSEVVTILHGTQRDRFHVFWCTLLYTGMRFGEAAALTWRDFDPQARTLTIGRSLERVEAGEPVLSDPKTYASARTLRIPQSLVERLRAHKKAQGQEKLDAREKQRSGEIVDRYRDHNLIFCSAFGAPLKHRNLYESFQRVVRRLKLPRASLHTCRHTAATNMLYAGVPLNEVSYILGHAGVDVTAKIYAHAIPRGALVGWTPPPGLRGLDLLEAWYDRDQRDDGVGLADAADAADQADAADEDDASVPETRQPTGS